MTDELSRLSEESVDVALRIGQLADSTLIARSLRKTKLVTLAAPSYLSRAGLPRKKEELAQHDCLVLVWPNGKPRPWLFRSGPFPVPSVMLVDHGPTMLEGIRAGLGVGQAFDFMVDGAVRDRGLVRLLESDTADGPDISAVCAPGRKATPRVRAAFDAFALAFAAIGT